MSRQHFRALTLVLLLLVVAAPLSSGDKGLWLTLVATPTQLFETAHHERPAEHEVLTPERGARAARVQVLPRADRVDPTRLVGTIGALPSLGQDGRWGLPDLQVIHPHGEPVADRPAPRAPPA